MNVPWLIGTARHKLVDHWRRSGRNQQLLAELWEGSEPAADLAKAQAFYGAVLGWQFPDPGNGHVGNISAPPGSAFGATDVTDLYFVVDDIDAAVQRVRAAGGTAEDVVHYDSGSVATCTDDQSVRFHLSVPADKYRR